jgi:hypothetical protein
MWLYLDTDGAMLWRGGKLTNDDGEEMAELIGSDFSQEGPLSPALLELRFIVKNLELLRRAS